jgi:hypothetical protein
LLRLTETARALLSEGDDPQASALDLLSDAAGKLARLAAIDPDTEPILNAAEALTDQLNDLTRSLDAYADGVEFNPERLAEVDERLNLIFNLKRKYGDSIEEVLAFGQRAQAELDALGNAEVRTAELEQEEARLVQRIGRHGAALSRARREAATRMAAEVVRELGDLRMERAHFDVDFQWQPQAGRRSRRRRGCAGRRRARQLWLRQQRPGPGRVPGVGQPRRAAQAAGQGRLGRRDLAADAGPQDGAGPGRPDADADLRRDRRGHRRPRGRAWWAASCGS